MPVSGPVAAPAPAPAPVSKSSAAVATARRPAHASRIGDSGSSAATRLKFTKEDDELLKKYVFEASQSGRALKGNKIYVELAEEVREGLPIPRLRFLRILRCLLLTRLPSTLITPSNPGVIAG